MHNENTDGTQRRNHESPPFPETIDGSRTTSQCFTTALRAGFDELSEDTRETVMNWLQLYLDVRFQIAEGATSKLEFSPLGDLGELLKNKYWAYHVELYTSTSC